MTDPYKYGRLTFGAYKARQAKEIQAFRLKAMNHDAMELKKRFLMETKFYMPDEKKIEMKFGPAKERKKIQYICDKKSWESLKDISEIVLSNFEKGNFTNIKKCINRTYINKGHDT